MFKFTKSPTICYCIDVDEATIINAVKNGADTLKKVKEQTKACTGNECKEKNPKGRCCSVEIKQIIKDNIKKAQKMEKKVFKTGEGVKINFLGKVEKQNIVTMVENCSTGQCECMSDDTKAKIKDMKVTGKDGDVALDLAGDVSVEEIQEALKKSKLINS